MKSMSKDSHKSTRETNPDVWIAPNEGMLPDFIVCGAMKSGTTTLHRILERHPKVFFADDELHFFNLDDIVEHPNFQRYYCGKWYTQDIAQDPKAAWEWYASQFADAQPGQLRGEDTTSYISSARSVERIALQKKDIKIIVLLRNPVDRTYSHYWHRVRAGRAIYNFEHTLLYEPDLLLRRSMYYQDLKRFFQLLPNENIRVYLFEDFIKDSEWVIKDLCEFLQIKFEEFPKNALSFHKNRTRIPRFFKLQLLSNRILRFKDNWRYLRFLPFHSDKYSRASFFFGRLGKKISKFINPMVVKRPPAMKPETRQHLTGFFVRELNGLNELIGRDVLSVWFSDNRKSK